MAQQGLIEYINKLLNSGYEIGTIRSTLINAGYNPAEVNRAISYAQKAAEPPKIISLNLKFIIIGIVSLILIVLIILGAIKILTPKPKTISLEIAPIETEAYPGGMLSFLVELTSDIDRKEQVLINYEVTDQETGKTVLTKQERPEVGTKLSRTAQINLPADIKPGAYTVKTSVSYQLGSQQKNLNFNVVEAPKAEAAIEALEEAEAPKEVTCPASCDDFNPCTTDYCEKGLCKHTPIMPCCGNGACEEGESVLNCADDCAKTTKTPQEIITQAKTAAAADPEAAAMLCNKLTRQNDVDLCFSEVAITAGKSVICENIQVQDSKDTCYMEFALDGDYGVCDLVKNSYLSKSCNSLKRSSAMLAQAEGIPDSLKQEPE